MVLRDFKKMGKFLKAKRIAANLSQFEVARKLGYSSSQYISNFERGLCAPPIKNMRALIDLYRLDANEVILRILNDEKTYLIATIKGRR